MGGIFILAIFTAYICIAIYIVNVKIQDWRWRIGTFAALTLLPAADAIYERVTFPVLCEKEAGLKVIRVIEGVNGFRSNEGEPSDEWLAQDRFRFVESSITNGLVTRKSISKDGAITSVAKVQPVAQYEYLQRTSESSAYVRQYRTIRSTSGNEEFGSFVNIVYRGGWVERAIGSIFASHGSVASCINPRYEDKVQLVFAVLKPAK